MSFKQASQTHSSHIWRFRLHTSVQHDLLSRVWARPLFLFCFIVLIHWPGSTRVSTYHIGLLLTATSGSENIKSRVSYLFLCHTL